MTPDDLAALHRAAFTNDRPWSADEFRSLLDSPLCHLTSEPNGFALWRSVAGETELLTIATHPDQQRRGIAARLMNHWMTAASAMSQTAFLEVAADNVAAIALYQRYGFEEIARRPDYYTRMNARSDALVMHAHLSAQGPA